MYSCTYIQVSFLGLLVMALPSFYIFPWYLFRFDGGKFSGKDVKKVFFSTHIHDSYIVFDSYIVRDSFIVRTHA